jgi:hypothetical protein
MAAIATFKARAMAGVTTEPPLAGAGVLEAGAGPLDVVEAPPDPVLVGVPDPDEVTTDAPLEEAEPVPEGTVVNELTSVVVMDVTPEVPELSGDTEVAALPEEAAPELTILVRVLPLTLEIGTGTVMLMLEE